MASSSFTGSTNSSYITPRILWSSTPNSDTNKSDITVTFQLCKSSSSTSSTYGTGSWVLNINNVPYSFSVKVTLPANNTYVTVYTKTVTGIDHNTDGTKSVPISVTGGISGTTYTTTSINGNAILDTILRASSLSVPTSVNTGSNLTTTITPVNTAFRHKVQYIIDGTAKYTSDYIAAGTTTFSYTIPHSWLPSSTSKSMTVRLYTYTSSGTSAIGQKDVATTVNVPDTIKPSISSFVATVGSGGLSGLYVQGKSTVKLTCTSTMGADATVSSYVFSGPGVNTSSTTNTTTSSVLTSSGTLTYKVKVTDSRGRYAEATVSIVVHPYTSPKIVSITAQRCDTSGTLKTDGTCTKVTVVTSHSSVNGKNTGNVVLFNSKDITSNKPTETTVISSTTDSNTYTGVYGSGFKIDTVYTISAKITDSYTSHTSSVPLGAAQRAFNIAKYGNGVAIGGLSTVTSKTAEGLFECNWDAKFIGDVDVTGSFRPATPLAIANGGTGATTAALARNALGLGNTTGALPIANGGTGATSAASARANLSVPATTSDGSHYAILPPDGSTTGWIRTPQAGLIPYASGGASSSLGTSDWKFANIHGVNIYENGALLSSKYKAKGGYITLLSYTTLGANASVTFTSSEKFSMLIVYTYATDGYYYPAVVTEPFFGSIVSQSSAQTTWPVKLSKSGNTYTLYRNGSNSLSYIVIGVQ